MAGRVRRSIRLKEGLCNQRIKKIGHFMDKSLKTEKLMCNGLQKSHDVKANITAARDHDDGVVSPVISIDQINDEIEVDKTAEKYHVEMDVKIEPVAVVYEQNLIQSLDPPIDLDYQENLVYEDNDDANPLSQKSHEVKANITAARDHDDGVVSPVISIDQINDEVEVDKTAEKYHVEMDVKIEPVAVVYEQNLIQSLDPPIDLDYQENLVYEDNDDVCLTYEIDTDTENSLEEPDLPNQDLLAPRNIKPNNIILPSIVE